LESIKYFLASKITHQQLKWNILGIFTTLGSPMLSLCQILEKVADIIFGIPEFPPIFFDHDSWLLHHTEPIHL
jgi:hypothetical protein